MSDYIGVLIGGLIGIIPSIVIVFVELYKMKKQQQFELEMRMFDLFRRNQTEALLSFVSCLGALSSKELKYQDLNDYFSASEKASCYANDELRDLITKANSYATNWENGIPVKSFEDLKQQIAVLVYKELSAPQKFIK